MEPVRNRADNRDYFSANTAMIICLEHSTQDTGKRSLTKPLKPGAMDQQPQATLSLTPFHQHTHLKMKT